MVRNALGRTGFLALPLLIVLTTHPENANGQITLRRTLSATPDRLATLEERLITRLHATTDQQQAFLKFVVGKVRKDQLEKRLVLAIERYAVKRNSQLPFNYFERALRFEAAKRGVTLPSVRQFVTTKDRD